LYLYNNNYQEETMKEIKRLESRREMILQEMRGLRGMRRGSVMEQHLKVKVKGKDEPELRGPYWLYTRKVNGKSVGERLGEAEAGRFREEVDSFHRFQALCREYAELSERLGELDEGLGEGSEEKKRRRLRSLGTRR
jgi:hypothetical protein